MSVSNYENVDAYPLDPEMQEQLLREQNECTFIWGPKDHWAVGVTMTYIWRDGSFWLTATSQRKRIAAIRRDPRVSVAVTSVGTSLGPARTLTAKGRVTIHEDDETKSWAYPAIATAILGDNPPMVEKFVKMLDSERRLVLEVVPERYITYDSQKMMRDTDWASL
jgi:hypothetical protein